jgi:heme/copper-type cytochrome/quinol oxidase subunit 3
MATELMSQPGTAVEVAPAHDLTAPAAPHAAHVEDHFDHADMRKTGFWLFLGSEVMFFAVLIIGNMMGRWKDPGHHEILNIPLTSLNTFLLLMSSFMVVLSLSSLQAGRRTRFLRFTAVSALLGAIFVFVQLNEYLSLYHEGMTLSSSLYGSTFFALTGFHGAHVIIGVGWLLRVFIRGFNGHYSPSDTWGVEMAGLYWHFVDVVWIVLFTVIYLF